MRTSSIRRTACCINEWKQQPSPVAQHPTLFTDSRRAQSHKMKSTTRLLQLVRIEKINQREETDEEDEGGEAVGRCKRTQREPVAL